MPATENENVRMISYVTSILVSFKSEFILKGNTVIRSEEKFKDCAPTTEHR